MKLSSLRTSSTIARFVNAAFIFVCFASPAMTHAAKSDLRTEGATLAFEATHMNRSIPEQQQPARSAR
jgi:hypothetical protein